MKKLLTFASGLLLLCANIVYGSDEYTFIEHITNRRLEIKEGSLADFEWAKEFCKQFFKAASGGEVQLDEDQKVFGSFDAFIESKFNDNAQNDSHRTNIFDIKRYNFFVVSDYETKNPIGYTIIHLDNNNIYSIETQVDINTYDIKNLMNGLIAFIKERVAPNGDYFISAVRKSMPHFVLILKDCGYVDSVLLHPSLSSQFYQALQFKL